MESAESSLEPLARFQPSERASAPRPGLGALGLSALGIVFGDIGTSPLYTLKTVLGLTGATPTPETVLGALSLIVWTLLLVTSVKYVALAMSIDNDGEGGILALMSLLGLKRQQRPLVVALGLFGAALIYGDGAVTPAISVLSALEGLDMAAPAFAPYVLPASVAVLVALFAIQPLGTAKIGRAFGPVMLLWFVGIGVLGATGIAQHPAVLAALNPWHGLHYLATHGVAGFLILGGVFLCVTGAEALYADMGHFGSRPIRLAWSIVVFPSLLLSYAGQSAIVLEGASTNDNIFFRLCPPTLLIPFVVLATVATIIASQSIITGAFSMTRQAIQLGWLPRLRIVQTSEKGYGQIYVGVVNWALMLVTVGLALGFRQSDNLASAYGIAVSTTMLLTTGLLFMAMREIWHWNIARSVAVAGVFLCIDLAFFLANLVKVADGGYVPLVLAAVIYGLMYVWHRGSSAVGARLREKGVPIPTFMASVAERKIPRVPGTGIFLTRTLDDTPPVMIWHVQQNRALHAQLLVVNATVESVPWIAEAERVSCAPVCEGFWHADIKFGFMEKPDIPATLQRALAGQENIDLDDAIYYLGHGTIVSRDDGRGLPKWEEAIYAAMERNSIHFGDFFRLPSNKVVLIGRQVEI